MRLFGRIELLDGVSELVAIGPCGTVWILSSAYPADRVDPLSLKHLIAGATLRIVLKASLNPSISHLKS